MSHPQAIFGSTFSTLPIGGQKYSLKGIDTLPKFGQSLSIASHTGAREKQMGERINTCYEDLWSDVETLHRQKCDLVQALLAVVSALEDVGQDNGKAHEIASQALKAVGE